MMARVLVTGPAGLLGSAVIPRLVARGYEVRLLVHQTRPSHLPAVEEVAGDVSTGAGLAEAVTGVDAVIHAATSALRRVQATDVGGTGQMLRATESAGAHLVYPSIVGVDQLSAGYYRAKWRAEQIVESGRCWTIQRATQFHPLIDGCSATACSRLPGIWPSSRSIRVRSATVWSIWSKQDHRAAPRTSADRKSCPCPSSPLPVKPPPAAG
jgi:uncharacterized protein YbjT (DUF2867 family)